MGVFFARAWIHIGRCSVSVFPCMAVLHTGIYYLPFPPFKSSPSFCQAYMVVCLDMSVDQDVDIVFSEYIM